MHDDRFSTSTSDRRRSQRRDLESPVRLTLETPELQGKASNISSSGILFFTEGELKVTVEIEENGETRRVSGSLVRCERIKGDHRGWAVEFDRA
jgi:hypothetical protein